MKKIGLLVLSSLLASSMSSFAENDLGAEDSLRGVELAVHQSVGLPIGQSVFFNIKDYLLTEGEAVKAAYKYRPDLFSTGKRLSSESEFENILIRKMRSSLYVDGGNDLYTEDINTYFVDALKTGNSRLADDILYNSGSKIDVNFLSSSPVNTPLMAVASSLSVRGGDVEYFMKLLKMGADPLVVTERNKINLLSFAAIANNYKIVYLLLNMGFNPLTEDGLGSFPLEYASVNQSSESAIIMSSAVVNGLK